jgi:MerR family copper efflux transcriptional regulator
MNIGEASKRTGVSTKMIRYYDEIGLVRSASRSGSNYREYDERSLNELRFVKRARNLGFSIDEITQLLSLWRDRGRSSRQVKSIANTHIAELDARASELKAMADTLRHLSRSCAGDDRPDCPILDDLGTAQAVGSSASRKSKKRP